MFKINESIIVIQAEATSPNRTNVVFWSHDRGTAKLRMKLVRKNGIPQSLPEGTTVPIRLIFKSATAEDGYGKHDYLATVEDPVNGIVSIVLEDNILGYVGTVEGSVYIDFPNDRSLDTAGRFTFDIKRSPIDDSTPELEDYYFNGFSQTIDKIEKILADGKQEIDAKLKDTNDKITKANQDVATLNTNIEAQKEKFDAVSIYNKAEVDSKVADLDSVKADKTALSQTNILLTNGLNSKVDKGGIEQVTLPMLTTEVKKAMTGGSVAVVSDGAVSTSTVVDKAITSAKAVASIQHPQVTLATDPPNYDTETKLLTFPSSGVTGGNSVITYGNGAKTYFIPNDGTFSVLNTLPTKSTKLIFDFSTNTMSFIEWNVQLTADQIVLLTMRLNGKHISSNLFPVTVDGEVTGIAANSISGTKLTPVGQTPIVTLVTDPPNYSTLTSTLTFPAQTTGGNSVITYGNTSKYFMIPNDGTFKVVNPLPTKSTKLIFDFSTNTMSFIEWNVNLTKNQAVLLTMRGNGQYISSNIFPVTVDRKMAGIGKDIATNNQVSGSSIQISKDAPIRCIAHRGYSNSYPEDTLVAYRGAKKAGINEVEMDLSWTSDNIPVNIHDSTINRTARNVDGSEIDETINVSNCSLAELKQYEYGSYLSPEFLGEQIPTFEDTLKQCKILDQVLHIDRCWGLGDDRLTILKNVMDKIDYHDVVFYIYHEDSLNRLRNIIPKADVMHLLLGGDITQESIDLCSTYNLSNKRGDGQAQILAKADGVTQAQVQKANNAGVKVNVWGADNADRQQLMSWGVTGFSTNYVNIQDELLDI